MIPDPEVVIQFARVPANKVGTKEEYFKIVHDAYTTQYLQQLGVEPTERHKKTVSRNAPLDKCEIEATWTEDSAIARELRIIQPPAGGFQARSAKSVRGGNNVNAAVRKWMGPHEY